MSAPCACRKFCGDVPEEDDPDGVCKDLPRAPEPPLVEIVVLPRAYSLDAQLEGNLPAGWRKRP